MGVSAFAPGAVLEATASEEAEAAAAVAAATSAAAAAAAADEEVVVEDVAPSKAGKAAPPAPAQPARPAHPPLSAADAARAAVKGAYLARIQTLALRPVLDQATRAAHLAEVEGRLAAAVAARSKLAAALGTARKEIVFGRLPFLHWRGSLTRWCVSAVEGSDGPDMGVRRRAAQQEPARGAPPPPPAVAAAAAALPTPASTTTTPLLAGATGVKPPSFSTPPPPVAWRPVYVPTFGAGASAWLRRLAPRHFARRALPAPQLEDVGRAAGSVARALWMVGDAAGGGGLGGDGAGGGAAHDVAHPPAAAALVAELSGLVEACLTEALAGLASARATFLAGSGASPAPDGRPGVGGRDRAGRSAAAASVLASVRSRWPTLRRLQEAQVRLVECGDGSGTGGGRPEDGILRAGGFLTTPRADGGGAGFSPPSSSSSSSLAVVAARVRWLALLFGVSEARRGLEELAAAVEALRDACECAALARRGGVALLEDEGGKGAAGKGS